MHGIIRKMAFGAVVIICDVYNFKIYIFGKFRVVYSKLYISEVGDVLCIILYKCFL